MSWLPCWTVEKICLDQSSADPPSFNCDGVYCQSGKDICEPINCKYWEPIKEYQTFTPDKTVCRTMGGYIRIYEEIKIPTLDKTKTATYLIGPGALLFVAKNGSYPFQSLIIAHDPLLNHSQDQSKHILQYLCKADGFNFDNELHDLKVIASLADSEINELKIIAREKMMIEPIIKYPDCRGVTGQKFYSEFVPARMPGASMSGSRNCYALEGNVLVYTYEDGKPYCIATILEGYYQTIPRPNEYSSLPEKFGPEVRDKAQELENKLG